MCLILFSYLSWHSLRGLVTLPIFVCFFLYFFKGTFHILFKGLYHIHKVILRIISWTLAAVVRSFLAVMGCWVLMVPYCYF